MSNLNKEDIKLMWKLDELEDSGQLTDEDGTLNRLRHGLFSGIIEIENNSREIINQIIKIVEDAKQ